MENYKNYCHDLVTNPVPETGKILVTGATGYIGGRLVPELIGRGYDVRVMVRTYSPEYQKRWPKAEVVAADALDLESLIKAVKGIHTAYFLIHSLGLGKKKFESVDLQIASNFRIAAENQGVKRIIFLSGLGDNKSNLSPHLKSRIDVANRLSKNKIPVTTLRAGMIIGSGSASYEILENLVKNTPVFFIPYWAKTKSQPIGIRDVIKYLVGCLENNKTTGKTLDIGGKDILTYDEKLKILASLLNLRRYFFPGLITYTPLYGYLASLLTPVPAPITKSLVVGCKNEVVCKNNEIRELIPFEPLTFKEALINAMTARESDKVSTRWSDAYPSDFSLATPLHNLTPPPKYTSSYCLLTYNSTKSLFDAFCDVGGENGWFHSNWMWRMRGMLDRLMMGVGSVRGRRSHSELRVNDVVDFWRVENIIDEKLLLLRAEMILPGQAWLEFVIDSYEGVNKLAVNAYFQPRGFKGILYWYNFVPFHYIIFKNLIKQIDKRAQAKVASTL